MVGLLPLAATATLTNDTLRRLPDFASHFEWFRVNKPQHVGNVVHNDANSSDGWLLSIVSPERLPRILHTMLDDDEFLSPFGIWFPLNYLLIEALLRFDRYLGDGFTIAYPSGGDDAVSLRRIAADLSARPVSLFTDDPTGSRPTFGDADRFQHDPVWHQQLLFHEYFNGDTGCGLGASHQTGWTGLSANLICAIEPLEP
jgi:hypothetical protein